MLRSIAHIWRLSRAGFTLARHGGLISPEQMGEAPPFVRKGLALVQRLAGGDKGGREDRVSAALEQLGPSYIKLGQFLATRPDLVGLERARALLELQDNMRPFTQVLARQEVEAGLGAAPEVLFAEFGPAIAAASVAQVHKAHVNGNSEQEFRAVAVKILRPGIEERFAKDVDSFAFAARMIERWHRPSRRLRPVAAVGMFARSVELEMDLRMEAAAMSEMRENTANDTDFLVPRVDWNRTSRRVLTTEWVDAMPLNDPKVLAEAGLDLNLVGDRIIQSFLRHAIRDGFFHADMHQGNLFADTDGRLIAVDFGIMGRLSIKDRRFLAEILHGFITRNYRRVSEVHFEAGYVPNSEDIDLFAQALRAIGEPLMDLPAEEISMARLLTQLFQVTEQFNMATQPQLLLLQKTMVVVEGVARTLNPRLNMWVTAEPVVRQWIEQRLGPQGRLEEAAEGAATLGRLAASLPEALADAQRMAQVMSGLASSAATVTGDAQKAPPVTTDNRGSQIALWVAAISLAVIAVAQLV